MLISPADLSAIENARLAERERILGIIRAEFDYWANVEPREGNQAARAARLACMIATGALANVTCGIASGQNVDKYLDTVRRRPDSPL